MCFIYDKMFHKLQHKDLFEMLRKPDLEEEEEVEETAAFELHTKARTSEAMEHTKISICVYTL